jgi:exodeoxyribonuclease-5
VEGVVFAKVLMKEPNWAGLVRQDKLLKKVTWLDSKAGRKLFPQESFPDWGSVLQHWQRCIHDVASEIRAGQAGVRFSNAEDLRYCDVKPLLRLDERQSQWHALQANAHATTRANAHAPGEAAA